MTKIAICDDEKIYTDRAIKIVANVCNGADIVLYENGEKLLKDFETKEKRCQIYILDIELPNINGMSIGEKIREVDDDVIIIYMTSHDRYVFDAFKIKAFRYVKKSELEENLTEAIAGAYEKVRKDEKETYTVVKDAKKNVIRIRYNNIVSIEKYGKNVEFVLMDGSVVKERNTLSNVMNVLKSKRFMMIKRGVVVNIEHIKSFKDIEIIMDNGVVHYAPRDRSRELKEKMLKLWGDDE